MHKRDRCTDDEFLCRGERCIFIETEIIRGAGIQPDAVVHRFRLCCKHLSLRRTKDGHDRFHSILQADGRTLWRTRAAHNVKGEISAGMVRKSLCMCDRAHQPSLRPVHILLRVRTDIVVWRDVLGDGQELLEKDRGLCRQPLLVTVVHAAERVGGVVCFARRA